MAINVTNHLNFRGDARAALEFYQSVFGGGSGGVSVLSSGHHHSDVKLDDPFVAYGRSRTANILFAVELDRRLRERGTRSTAVHPWSHQD